MTVLMLSMLFTASSSFSTTTMKSSKITARNTRISSSKLDNDDDDFEMMENRRNAIGKVFASGVLSLGLGVMPAQAKVEGYAPPKKSLPEEYRQGTAALADMDADAPIPREAYKKLPSGVIYADLRVGSGEEVASEGSRVNIQWVLRKSNGYFVDSSEVSDGVPFIFTVGDKSGAIAGVDEGIRGMKVGGVRRLLIPPKFAYVTGVEDGKPGPVPAGFGPKQQMRRVMEVRRDVPGEYIFLEIQLTRLR
eukprot:CAMPEP_0185731422 /NCGR_PEP_ID=MMETSP1171-20130828/12875_1 /TAXON_ID=374046 /ORGANISM="Helicotheca tamensis, Strain CCMP826" /LENGTH=248 /DNA_ID=CAMNT_0028400685 /DNA_START=117 /DNA_END=863 /DNA_ORIENTATION=+